MTEKNVSVKFILQKLYRDLGTTRELPFDDIVEWTHEALMFIGAYSQFNRTGPIYLDVVNYKASLPCNFHKIEQLSYLGKPIRYSGSSMDAHHCKDCVNNRCASDYSYYVNDSYIVTSFPTGTLCMSYLSMPIDSEGFPEIPDDVYYIQAVVAYVTFMLDRIEWRKSNLADKVFQKSENDWNWYTQAARSKANMPSLSQLESLKNILVRLKPLQNEYNQFFMNLGKQERRKLH
jgi:hypothetical protein